VPTGLFTTTLAYFDEEKKFYKADTRLVTLIGLVEGNTRDWEWNLWFVSEPAGTKMTEGVVKAVKDHGRSLVDVLMVENWKITSNIN
jgi:hypothetical protein